MSGKRYFYPPDRLHHAVCMAIDFGMIFKSTHGQKLLLQNGQFYLPFCDNHCYGGPLFIDSGSLPLLEPKVGDVLQEDERPFILHLIGHEIERLAFKDREGERRIIQRDGKPFHWPQSEAA
jgi:hypothetical protein